NTIESKDNKTSRTSTNLHEKKDSMRLKPWSVSLSNCTSRLYLRSKDTLALRLPDAFVTIQIAD
ncbi:hypothetical protein MEN95_22015, partial [Dolichospermum sp. ST_sed7]|nr:hypothetical protein [Dolichospermum sp. ST_sed7]